MATEENNKALMDDIEFINIEDANDAIDSIDINTDDNTKNIKKVEEDDFTIEVDIDEELEDTKEDKNIENKSGEDTNTNSDEDSTNTLSPFAATLKEEGVLPDLNLKDEEGNDIELTGEVLINAVKEQIKKNEFADLNQDQKNILEIMRVGGDVSSYLNLHKKQIDSSEKYSEINNENAEEFAREYFAMKGLSKEEIDDNIDDMTINNTLVDRMKKYKPNYDKAVDDNKKASVESAKQQQIKEQEAYNKNIETFKEYINSTDSFIKGQKLDTSVKEKIFKMATEPVGTDKNGNPQTAFQKTYSENPNKTEAILNYIHYLTDGFSKMENITYSKTSKSQALKDLNEKIIQDKNNRSKITSTNKNNNKQPNIYSAMDKFVG